jgi:CheY-like chemotaxis protein
VIRALQESRNTPEPEEAPLYSWEGFSFREKINSAERSLIERALRDANGSVTRAARLLGFNHHQSLISLINSRHQKLHQTRTAVRKRRRHICSHPEAAKTASSHPAAVLNEVSILHARDNEHGAFSVNDLLAKKAWRVELCPQSDALNHLAGNKRIDLLLIDHEQSGTDGMDLIKRARQIAHRPRLPIVMVSADDCETEARRAGVDSFLRSDQISELASTVSRLLKEDQEEF